MANEVKLVMEIEKHGCLYNYKLAEYSRKDITEKAWEEVSKNTNLSVNSCKEKWRNIRSSFLRSLKTPPSGSKAKKPYYLREYLHFILSYIKPQGQTSGNNPESQTGTISGASQASTEEESQHESEGVASIQESATEEVRSQSEPYTAASSNLTRSEPSTPYGRRRKRAIPEVEKTFIDYLKTKTSRQAAQAVPENRHGSQTVDNPMQHFFMSLLPEFDTMPQDEIRAFKIKVLVLIDDIKSKRSVRAPDSAFSIVSCPTPLDSISSNSSATPSTFYQISHEFTHNYDTETPSPHSQEVNTIENLANNNDISEPTVNIHSYMHDFNTN